MKRDHTTRDAVAEFLRQAGGPLTQAVLVGNLTGFTPASIKGALYENQHFPGEVHPAGWVAHRRPKGLFVRIGKGRGSTWDQASRHTPPEMKT